MYYFPISSELGEDGKPFSAGDKYRRRGKEKPSKEEKDMHKQEEEKDHDEGEVMHGYIRTTKKAMDIDVCIAL